MISARIIHAVWGLLSITLFFSCANVVSPSGGAKDTTPPKLLGSTPPHLSTQFKHDKIILTFDEFVQLNNPSQILISPPLEKKPEFRIRKKSIIVQLKDSLLDSATYNINFGESIIDNTESNKLKNFQYVFSTGDYVDSLMISGKVVWAKDLSTEADILVMLYPDHRDSVPYLQSPYYFTKTKSSGEFVINYLKAGTYKLFALKDQNFNYLFDQPNESIAFSDTLIRVDTLGKRYQMMLFDEIPDKKLECLETIHKRYGKVEFVFSKPADSVRLVPLRLTHSQYSPHYEYSTVKDTLLFWVFDPELDSMDVVIYRGKKPLDTTTIMLKSMPRDSLLKTHKFRFKHNIEPFFDINSPIKLSSGNPIRHIDTGKIVLLADTNKIKIRPKIAFGDTIRRQLLLETTWKQGISYQLRMDPGAITDVYGLKNDTIAITFTTRKKEEYGIIQFELDTMVNNYAYIIRLYDSRQNVSRETAIGPLGKKTLTFDYLLPDKYSIRVIEDRNNNRQWDTGHYLEKRQPERVFKYSGAIDLRANWEIEVQMELDD